MPGTKAQAGPVGLDARTLAASLRAMLAALREHEEELNRLNVFPVRDHDTGSNMALTLQGMVAALDALREPEPTLAGIAKAAGGAALEEARGNSGVILAEALRGLLDTFAPLERAGPADLARAFRAGAAAAREAVLDPVEGTILSVADAAAGAAVEALAGAAGEAGLTVAALLARVAGAAGEAVAATQRQLGVLRDAGVVDAAGYGLQLCLDAFAATVAAAGTASGAERAVDSASSPPAEAARLASGGPPGEEAGGHAVHGVHGAPGESGGAADEPEAGGTALFEVQYLLACDPDAAEELAAELGALGDSVAVARGNGVFRVHVHTRRAGAAIEAGLRHGTPSRIQINYLGPAEPGDHR
jgi:dihydroxyacetone kinase-like predicted kinase